MLLLLFVLLTFPVNTVAAKENNPESKCTSIVKDNVAKYRALLFKGTFI